MNKKLICLFAILAFFAVSKNLIGQCNVNFCSDPPILTADAPYFDVESESLIIENVTFGKTGCDEVEFNTGIGLYIYQLLPNGDRMYQCTVLNPAPSNYVGSVVLGFGNPDLCDMDAFNYGTINARPENGFVACDGATYEIELALYITEVTDLDREISIYEQLGDDQYIINSLGTVDVHLTDQFPGNGLPLTTAKIEEFLTGATGTIELTCGDDLQLAVEAISRLSNCPPLDDISIGIPSEMTNDFYYSVDGAAPVILQSPDLGAAGGQLTGLNGEDVCYAGLLGVRTLEFSELDGVCDGSTVIFTVKTTDTFTGQTEEDQITVRYTGGSCEACPGIPGCTNIDACNYNPEATEEDNSCTFPVENFDCDGNCLVEDDCAGNCGGTATTDCEGVCEGTANEGAACDDGDPTTIGDVYDGACNCVGTATPGCIDETACNYNELATVDDGSCSFPETNFDCDGNCLVEEDCTGNCGGTAITDCEGVCEGAANAGTACDDGDPTTTGDVYDEACNCVGTATPGCIDETACNYNELATVDDGSCSFPETNFDCNGNCLVEEDCSGNCGGTATTDCEGVCEGAAITGSTCDDDDPTTTGDVYDGACNCVGTATPGCIDETACNYNELATVDDGSCTFPETNFDCDGNCLVEEDCTGNCGGTATTDCEGVCEGTANSGTPCDDGDPTTTGDVYDGACNCVGIATPGCIDETACNYNELATVDDGSCTFPETNFDCDGNCLVEEDCAGNCGGNAAADCEGVCEGPTNAGAACDDGDPTTTGDVYDGACNCVGTATPGCIDETACNYNELATVDDGSCSFPETNFDCNGNCIVEEDCEGTCGGTVTTDCTGECGGDVRDGAPCGTNGMYDAGCECIEEAELTGCMDATACNYDENATIEGPCYVEDCTGECNGTATVDCEDVCEGLTNAGAACDDGDPTTTGDVYDSSCNCAGIATAGCTDIAACNYDELATVNDDSCIYESYYFNCNCDEPCPAGFNQDEDCNCNSQCGPAADAGENAEITICENDAPFDLFDILNGTPEAGGQWVYENKGGPYITSTFTPGVSEDGDYVYFHWQGDECPFSEATVTVTTNPVSATENTATICEGETYTLPDGTEVTTSGSFETILTSSLGCDSIIVTLLSTLELDCEGVCEGDALPGSPCDDGNPSTIGDVYNNECICQGTGTAPVLGCTDPTACNYDENATIEGPCYTEDCAGECNGTAIEDCAGDCGGTAFAGTACDDADPTATYNSNCDCVPSTTSCESVGGTISFSNANAYGDGSFVCYEATVTVTADDFILSPFQSVYYVYHTNGPISDLAQLQDIITIGDTFENFAEQTQIYVTAIGATANNGNGPDLADYCAVFSNTLTVNLLDPIEIDIQTECDSDNGEFSYSFTVNGGLPGSVPSMSYAIISDYWNGELKAGEAQLVGPISDAENFTIIATDPNDCTSSTSKTVNCTKLPISLISFIGEATETGDQLKWLSASEIENDYYTLQYSTNGIEFKSIATVKGAGNKSTPSQYEYLNRETASGLVYYKLWQTDFDQTNTELKVISLNRGETANQIVDIFPVPVSNQLNIIYHSISSADLNIKIYNAMGEIISETISLAIEGNNFLKFDTKDYTSGMYMVSISSGESISTSKIIVE